MVEKLHLLKDLEGINRLPKKWRIEILAQLLNSYFEDLESAVYTKIRIEKRKNK
jgi:hypothetical protein